MIFEFMVGFSGGRGEKPMSKITTWEDSEIFIRFTHPYDV